VEPTRHRLRVINSYDVLAVGIIRDLELRISDWKGKFFIKVILLDENDLVLSLEFFGRMDTMIHMRH